MEAQTGFASGVHNQSQEGVAHLRPMNVSRNGVIDLAEIKYVSATAGKHRLEPDDILFNNTNSDILVGKTALFSKEGEYAFSNHMTRLRFPKESVHPKFMAFRLHSFWIEGLFKSICNNHVSQASVSTKALADLEVALPSLDEQRLIVETLDDHLSRLDKALAEVEHGRAREKLFKRSLLHSLFENLEADVLELGEVSKPKYGKDVPKHLRGESFTYPVVGSAGVMTYTDVPLVEEPSVLVGRKGNVGAVQMFPTPCSPVDTAYYLVCPDDVDLEFMYFQLQSIDLKALDSSTTIPSLRRQDLEAVQFRKPDLATQKKIAEEIKVKLASVDAALDELSNIAAALSVLRRSLLNAAFTGALLKVVR